jgi:hypothetical protein
MQEDEYVMPEMSFRATMIPARYTEVLSNLMYYPDTKTAIDEAMSDYPLYQTDPDAVRQYGTAYAVPSRDELNTKILNHYKYYEIGQETVGRWLFELKTALNEIMPYYNQLFYSADQDFNPIYNVDYKKIINGTQNNSSNSTTSGSDTASSTEYSKGVNSKTPQDELHISDTGIDNVNYADDASWGKSSGSSSGTSTTTGNTSSNGSNSTVETTKGNFGVVSAQDLIIKYRDTILNIEQQIINDPRIKELFMLIF